MRIISGQFKGKKLLEPNDKKTRPLKDLVKESIFNIIEHSNEINFRLNEAVVLDLFSGSGSFGLECVSRGAKKVIFNENYINAIEVLEKNIRSLNCDDKCEVLKSNCFNLFKKFNQKVDIIFMDPPFKEKQINILIKNIISNKFLNKNGIIIIHRHKKDDLKITDNLNILDVRNYGISKIIIGN